MPLWPPTLNEPPGLVQCYVVLSLEDDREGPDKVMLFIFVPWHVGVVTKRFIPLNCSGCQYRSPKHFN